MRIVARKKMDTIDIARAFFDRAEIPRTANTVEKLLAHIDAHAARIIVKHDRQVGSAINRQRITDESCG